MNVVTAGNVVDDDVLAGNVGNGVNDVGLVGALRDLGDLHDRGELNAVTLAGGILLPAGAVLAPLPARTALSVAAVRLLLLSMLLGLILCLCLMYCLLDLSLLRKVWSVY